LDPWQAEVWRCGSEEHESSQIEMLMHIRRLCSTKFNTEEYYGLPQVFSSEDEWTWERTEEISKYPNPGKPCNLYAGETPESSPNRQLNAATQLKHEKT